MRLSLRARIFLILMLPLIFVAFVAISARYYMAERMSEGIYDNALLTVAHIIARDVLLTEGDLLTENLLADLTRSLGDRVYYRVDASDGGFITGYSRQPSPPPGLRDDGMQPLFFNSIFNGRPVRVVSLREQIADHRFSGISTVTVWQTTAQRAALSRQLAGESALLLGGVILAAAVLLWFGIQIGLRPLLELREAISRRSPDDLQPIRRWVPPELQPLVDAANGLFARLAQAFSIRDALISDAAHQIRNPIASLQAQAEAARSAPSEADLRERVAELATTARQAGRLTNQLLSMERVRGRTLKHHFGPVDLLGLTRERVTEAAEALLPRDITVDFDLSGTPAPIEGDAIMLQEMLTNLLDNAQRYGLAPGGRLSVTLAYHENRVTLTVRDDGPGIPEPMRDRVFDRFVRLHDDPGGCGLGLAIATDVASAHGGRLDYLPGDPGAAFRVTLPR